MDVSQSNFWQDVVLTVFMVPAIVGIGVSTYYAQQQQRREKGKPRPPAPPKAE
jgi:hypothetical protein